MIAHLSECRELIAKEIRTNELIELMKSYLQKHQKSAETGAATEATTSAPSSSPKGDNDAEVT